MNLELVFLILGVLIGVFSHISYRMLFRGKKKDKTPRVRLENPNNESSDGEDDWSDESADENGFQRNGPTKAIAEKELFEKYPLDHIKMVLVVREDLKMGKGKIGAQCGHATLAAY